jgi:hypothetical protein
MEVLYMRPMLSIWEEGMYKWQTSEWIPLHREGMGREGGARPRGWVWTLVFQIFLIAQRIETMQLKIVKNYDENSH